MSKKKKKNHWNADALHFSCTQATIAWNNLKPYGLKNANAFIGMHETIDTPIFF